MPFNRRWQRNGVLTGFVKTSTGVRQMAQPVQAWLQGAAQSRFKVAPSQPQAVQGPQPDPVTAVDPNTNNGALPVTDGATLQCNLGLGAGRLNVVPASRPANATDAKPLVNISPCGMCCTLSNPAVAAATAAALGVLTPMPCVPVTSQWRNTSPTASAGGAAALQPASTLNCTLGGTISIIASAY